MSEQHMTIRNTCLNREILHHEVCSSLRNGDTLIVTAPQKAVFLKDGKVTACYEAGRYTWSEAHDWPHGGKLFYVDPASQETLKWYFRLQNPGRTKPMDLYGAVEYRAEDAVRLVQSMEARGILELSSNEASRRLAKHLLRKRLPDICMNLEVYSDRWYLETEDRIADMLYWQLDMVFAACGIRLERLTVDRIGCADAAQAGETLSEFDQYIDVSLDLKPKAAPARENQPAAKSKKAKWNPVQGVCMWINPFVSKRRRGDSGSNAWSPLQSRPRSQKSAPGDAFFKAAAGEAQRGETFALNIAMFSRDARERAERILRMTDRRRTETESGLFGVDTGSVIRIRLLSSDIPISDDVCERKWNGELCVFQYLIEVPEHYPKNTLQLRCRVYADDQELTELKLVLKLDQKPQEVPVVQQKNRTAFASYSSKDRSLVAARLQGMMAAAMDDLDIFFDVESIRCGENWERRIKTEIRNRSLFYLFWSRNAMQSEYVDRELRWAMELKSIDDIEPIPLEKPELCPPPAPLNSKHFFDRLLNYTDMPVYVRTEDTQ